ncbi:MAG TPA: hypothetical protein PK280_18720 [Planctomycetota bacterium]|nr:hypothetical protein [Planctomycetota bacterium]
MSFWETDRNLVLGAGVALLVCLAVHFLVAGPSRSEAAKKEANAAWQYVQVVAHEPTAFLTFAQARKASAAEGIFPTKSAPKPSADFGQWVRDTLVAFIEHDLPSANDVTRGYITEAEKTAVAKSVEDITVLAATYMINEQLPMSAPEVLKAIKAEHSELEKVLGTEKVAGRVSGLLLVCPVVTKNADNPRFNLFERRLAGSRDKCNASGIFPRYDQSRPESCPLGFTPEVQKDEAQLLTQALVSEKEKEEVRVQQLLDRLSAANRLTDAVIEASGRGVLRVRSCIQRPVRMLASPQVSRMHLRVVPMAVRMTADEKGLVAFVERISRAGSFLAIENLSVEVTDPKAKTFNLSAQVLALVPKEGPGPARPGDRSGPGRPGQIGNPVAPIGRY